MAKQELLGQFGRNAGQTAELFYGDDVQGVVHVFATTTARNLIPGATFRNGEICIIQADDSKWKWNGSAWVAYTGFGGGGGGGGMGFRFTYSTTTADADPGAGTFRGNNATLSSVTTLFVDLAEFGGTDVTAWLDSLDDTVGAIKGIVRLSSQSDPTKWIEYTLTGWTTATGYRKLTVAYKDGPGGLTTTAGDTFFAFDAYGVASSLNNQALTNAKSLSYNGEVNNTGATPAIDFTAGDLQKITASANCAPTFVAPAGVGWVQICFIQDATPRTFTQPGTVTGSPPQPSTVASSRTFYQYFYDGTNYHYSAADTSTFALVDGTRAFTGGVTITQAAVATGSPAALKVTGGAHTTLTASTQAPDVDFALARTVQFATGAIASQRAVRITAPTYAFVGASAIAIAATVGISGPPVAGTNATLSASYALWIESGDVKLGTDTAVAAATAASVTLSAANATGTGATVGGSFILASGTGFTGGDILLRANGFDSFNVAASSSSIVAQIRGSALHKSFLQFVNTGASALPYVIQAAPSSQATGRPLVMCGQNAATTGGAVVLTTGNGPTPGRLSLMLGGYVDGTSIGTQAIMFEAVQLAASRRITALNYTGAGITGVTTTEMPTNTGDLVTFMGDALTIPSANGVNGHIYYSDGAKPAWRFNSTNLRLNGTHATASAGAGAAAPATVEGYLDVQINGTQRKMPYYAA